MDFGTTHQTFEGSNPGLTSPPGMFHVQSIKHDVREEQQALDTHSSPGGSPSFACNSLSASEVLV